VRVGELIAMTATERCTDVAELRNRLQEIGLLYELSSLLVRGGRVKDTLRVSLESALRTLRLDAGAIMLLPEDTEGLSRAESEGELERSAAIGLSEEWLSSPIPLSTNREFDRACLAGEVVAVEDLPNDPRIIVPEDCVRENLGSFLGAGMVFDGRPIGVIRLYGRTNRVFTKSEQSLVKSIGQSTAAAVEQARMIKMKARERRTQRALKIASAVQKRMLPEKVPQVPGVQLAARFRPSQQISGDFYDLFTVRDKLGLIVGDVVGKGIGAGMLMSSVRATLRAYAELSDDLSRVMARTNDALCRDTSVNEFATIWYGVLDPQSRELNYVLAGHDPPVLFRAENNEWRTRVLEGRGLVAGVISGERYRMESVQLVAGDVLVAYTDGMTDATNFEKTRFGRDRLLESVRTMLEEQPDASADEILKRVFWTTRQFSGLSGQADDETMVVMRID
jgi:sigma-B regulation protein RsbU (phosphoserine phosphatase)